jgi:hypothetical protein
MTHVPLKTHLEEKKPPDRNYRRINNSEEKNPPDINSINIAKTRKCVNVLKREIVIKAKARLLEENVAKELNLFALIDLKEAFGKLRKYSVVRAGSTREDITLRGLR